MEKQFKVIFTADGSQTILDTNRNTTYHSTNGAVTESKQVFIEAGLKYLVEKGVSDIRILELGFGTGLNAFLSFLTSRDHDMSFSYVGIEAYPLPTSITEKLAYPIFLDARDEQNVFRQMHTDMEMSNGNFAFKVLHGKVEKIPIPLNNTLVYYDAFGPGDQNEMWQPEVLAKVVNSLTQGGVLVTYCAQGQFKRNLKQLGCKVESLPGPPGKREMVRATLL